MTGHMWLAHHHLGYYEISMTLTRQSYSGRERRAPAQAPPFYSPGEDASGATGACGALQGLAETVSAGPRQVRSGTCKRLSPHIDVCIVVCDRIHTFRHCRALDKAALSRLRVRNRNHRLERGTGSP